MALFGMGTVVAPIAGPTLGAASAVTSLAFVTRELLCREPVVELHIFANRNFCVGTILTGLYGVILHSVTAFLLLFLQTMLDYSAMNSGFVVSPHGLGSMLAMLVTGALATRGQQLT